MKKNIILFILVILIANTAALIYVYNEKQEEARLHKLIEDGYSKK